MAKVEIYPNKVIPNPVLSVCVSTYQHIKYISQCIDGILNQQVDFPFEIIIGDDESTDGTREICINYAKKFPDKIRLVLHKRENNITINGTPTGRFNFIYNLFLTRGEYVALCDGDDYWTDPYKLQKQVDLLRNNKSIISFTGHFKKHENREELNTTKSKSFGIKEFVLKDRNTLPVCSSSAVYNNVDGAVDDFASHFTGTPNGDFPFFLTLLSYGNGFFLEDTTLVHRLNEGVSRRFNWETIYQTRIPVLSFLLERKKNEYVASFLKKELRNYYWLYGLTLLKRGKAFTGFRYIISYLAIWLK